MSGAAQQTALLGLLKTIEGLSDLDDDILLQMAETAHVQNVGRGDALIREGDPADMLYIVLKGRFTVLAGALAIAEIQRGEPIGELAFFAGGTRTATVIAARDSSVMCFSRRAYDALTARTPALANGILTALSRRLVRAIPASPGLRPQPGRVCAVLPGAGQPLPPALMAGLRVAFESHATWKVLTEKDYPHGVGDDTPRIAEWLEAQEAIHGSVLLLCSDPFMFPAWRRAVANNCDTIFVAVPKGAAFGPGDLPSPLERQVYQAKMEANVQLVLYRETYDAPTTGTAAWLEDRLVGLHHHIALDRVDDFARLGRFVRGEAVGLVMCGGGSFGTAHLGAIKVLRERGYHIDFVGGTSVGSAMAGALAMGIDPDHVMEQCEDIFLRSKAMSKLTVPRHALLDHHTLDAAFVRHYGAYDVEDLPLNFFAVATSLTKNDVRIIRTGPLWQAIRASTAIPGIFPPMLMPDGEVLIDGSLIDNVPLDEMRALKSGPNIVLNFLLDQAWRVEAKYEDLPNRWQALASLLRRPGKDTPRHPTAFNVLARSMVVNARRLLSRVDVGTDVLLNLSVLPEMSFMDWRKGRALFETAQVQMVQALDAVEDADTSTDAGRMAHLRAASAEINDVGAQLGLTTR